MSDDYRHDDFAVVRTDGRFGRFEELELNNHDMSTRNRFLRKSMTPYSNAEIDDLLSLQKLVMKDGRNGTIHPMYDYGGRKWVLMSVPDEDYGATGLAT